MSARQPSDVVAAVDFARAHHLRLVVKGGGHSYQGTSNAADSLLVWTRAMSSITLHDGFVGTGCSGSQRPAPAVTVEAGAVWMDVYDAVTTTAGRYVQGGGCATVGVAGLVQSGGFGSFSRRFGTAAASLIEAEIVTADGALRRVNACRNVDLFWALKGGGGGSLGVVTKLTLRTHDLPDRLGGLGATIKAANDAAFHELIARFVGFYAENLFNPHWGEQASVRPDNSLHFSMVSQGLDTEQAKQAWRPFFDWVSASNDEFTFTKPPDIDTGPARGWWDAQGLHRAGSTSMIFDDRPGAPPIHAWWAGDQDQVGAFIHGYDSVWLPASLLQGGRRQALADALFAASRHTAVGLHFNKGLAGGTADVLAATRDTATNPVVLEAFALAIMAAGGPPAYSGPSHSATYLQSAHRDAAAVDKAAEALRLVAPQAGSYVSESNYFNDSWQAAFWGANYPRLRAVKAKYDPDGLFIVHHGVGSEDWSPDGFVQIG
ncbi:MAG TPA: FAD-binding oxidoreductase [Caulobacteraceae bacterium]